MRNSKSPTYDEINRKFEEFVKSRLESPVSSDDVMMMDYHRVYLSSKLWGKIKRRVLKRDNKTCIFCEGKATIVHHRSYDREVLQGNADHMLASLCMACHNYIHIDDTGNRRSMEETDRILLQKSPPTDIPDPILDLRKKSPRPPEWHRMNSIQRKAWIFRNNKLREERNLALKEKGNSALQRRKNNPMKIGNTTWIPLTIAVEQYRNEAGAPSNAYGWYRKDAMRDGFVSIANASVRAKKIKNTWHVDEHEFSAAIDSHREARKLCQKMTEDYANGIFHGSDGDRIETGWGYYENRGNFRYQFLNMLAMRMREPGSWYCKLCNVKARIDDDKNEVSCPKCQKIQLISEYDNE